MRILCQKSGLLFKVEYFPYFADQATMCHPAFSLPQKKLLTLTSRYFSGELTEVDSYLLYLALLDSTSQVEFRTACLYTPETASLIANNMEYLLQVIGQINCISHPAFVLPRIAITKENHTLENSHYWIANWETSIEDFKDGYASQRLREDLSRREAALEKLIKTPSRELTLAAQIANWAEIAGSFPRFDVVTQFGTMQCADYWKLIIRKCINAESIFSIPEGDIKELISHCEEYIDHGTIYSHTLMSLLRNGLEKQTNFLGLGETTSFVLLQPTDSVQTANLQLLLQSAPQEEPRITEYPTKFEWLKAHSKWRLATQYNEMQQNKEESGEQGEQK